MIVLPKPLAFVWDQANKDKNWLKHQVDYKEAEEVFFDDHKRLYPDAVHSAQEERNILVGSTRIGRLLFIVFTIRQNVIRVISARDLNYREKRKQL